MKKLLLGTALIVTGLCADAMTDMAKDAAMSKAKTEARKVAVDTVAGNDAVKKELANKAADAVLGKEDPVDKVKSDAVSSVMGGKSTTAPAGAVVKDAVKGTPKESSLEDKALEMAAEKAVGSNPLKKAAAKEAIKSAL